eukprot:3881845-Rhodomonas_salina.1
MLMCTPDNPRGLISRGDATLQGRKAAGAARRAAGRCPSGPAGDCRGVQRRRRRRVSFRRLSSREHAVSRGGHLSLRSPEVLSGADQ